MAKWIYNLIIYAKEKIFSFFFALRRLAIRKIAQGGASALANTAHMPTWDYMQYIGTYVNAVSYKNIKLCAEAAVWL